jgi:hypothetical protein
MDDFGLEIWDIMNYQITVRGSPHGLAIFGI